MTSLAFLLGCVPLWTASGSGAVSRQVMGTAVIGGIASASAIAIFIIPALFTLLKNRWCKHEVAKVSLPPAPEAGAATAGDD